MAEQDELLTSRTFGLCRLPPGSSQVIDADEEVFILYTSVASRNVQDGEHAFRGLGYLDSHQDVLTLEFTVQIAEDVHAETEHVGHKRKHAHKKKPKPPEEKTFQVQLAQDTTALRSRKGDTGSVLWRASMEFAQLLLRQCYSHAPDSLLDPHKLSEAHVLELGAGTGLLSVLLSPLTRHYTVTDIGELVHLLAKNLSLNNVTHEVSRVRTAELEWRCPVTVDGLDWLAVHHATPSARHSLLAYPTIDLLLVVDCIYHPSLLPALVNTIDQLTTPGRTTVLVVAELRAEDVVREFLEQWLRVDVGRWEIWHAHEVMAGPYAVWIGRKKPPEEVR